MSKISTFFDMDVRLLSRGVHVFIRVQSSWSILLFTLLKSFDFDTLIFFPFFGH